MNRRTFVSSLAAGAAVVASKSKLFAAGSGSKASVGMIGCGWYGGVDLESLTKYTDVEVVSLCDVNAKAIETTLATVAQYQTAVPRTFSDYRKMLASRKHDIVIVATPDHWHVLPAIAAIKAGADVFVEKPTGADVIESEALVAAARKYDRVVQVNTQRRSTPHFAKARDEFLKTGKLGAIGAIETYCYMGMGRAGTLAESPPPEHLDYDMWTGPAPMVPFTADKESRGWRRYMEYGNGIVGDMCVHMFDAARWMMGLGWPQWISSTGGIFVEKDSSANTTDTQLCVFQYPDLRVTWEHRTWGASPIPNAQHWTDNWGVRFIGSKGTLNITLLRYEFIPSEGGEPEGFHLLSPDGDPANADFENVQHAWDLAEEAHAMDFMAARANRTRPVADVGDVHISSASCVLANIALQLGRPVSYDPKTRTVPGDDEATSLLARTFRSPWKHPDPTTV